MERKRKAPNITSTQSTDLHRAKKQKGNTIVIDSDSEKEHESDSLEEDEWYIKCILDETESQYLIDWEGPWSPTWEPKEHANDGAVQVWEQRKKRRNALREALLADYPPTNSSVPNPSTSEHEQNPPEIEESILQTSTRSNSPLFVPFGIISETPQVSGTRAVLQDNRVIEETPLTNRALRSEPRATVNCGDSSRGDRSTNSEAVFVYTPRTSIPRELRLPDEAEDDLVCDTRSVISPTSQAASTLPPAVDGHQSDTEHPDSPATDILSTVHGPVLASIDRFSQVDEIAETPAPQSGIVDLPILLSQSGAISRISGTQSSSQTTSYRSPYKSLLSRIHLRNSPHPPGSTDHPLESVSQSVPASSGSLSHWFARSISSHRSSLPVRSASIMDDKNWRESPSMAETMEKYSHIEGATPREKMANAYAQMRARANGGMSQNADPSATPSSAGDIEPSAPVSVPETAEPLSIRVEKESALPIEHEMHPPTTGAAVEPTEVENQHLGLQTIQPSALTVTHVEEPSPGSVHLGPSEFAVPLPMDSRVKDDYERILEAHAQNVQDFLKGSYPQENIPEHDRGRLVSAMYNLLRQLSNVTTHPDLNITEHIKDSSSDLKQEAAWAEYSSAKFLFLGYLAENATSKDIHLVVMVHGEKTQKVVERYLLGKGLVYTRPRGEMGTGTNLEVSMTKGSLSFGIQSTQNDGVIGTYRTPSAIIAMDSSFSPKNPMVEHVRTTFARDGNLLPAIRLVVSNSSEHVELCFPNFPELRRLYLLVQYTMRLRDVVGDLQDDALGVQEDAEEIITYLVSDNFNAHWSLPLVEPLHIVDAGELDLTQSQHPEQSGNNTPFPAPQIQKRLHTEEESSGQSSKRPRTETSQEASQQTESTKFPSQTLDNDLHLLERHLVHLRSAHATEVESLRKALTQVQSGLQAKEKALETLQHRYESRTQEFHRTRQERDRLNETKSSSEQRVERQKEELMKLKDERTQLRHELEKAREELKSGGGSIAELEAAREEIRRLGKENANLERKAEYEAKQGEYTREQYQNASTTAAQSVNEIRQLRQENEALKRKVDGNAVQLRELNLQNDEARHLARVHEVEAMLRFREDLLRRKEDELREIRKNRPSTRSTSTQPRSPKITANSRPTSPGIGGRGSGLRFSSEMSLP